MKIEDGTGKGFEAKVDDLNRMHTHAFNVPLTSFASTRGDAFNISSGLVTLTTAGESGLLYIKNNECDDISVITEFINIGVVLFEGFFGGIAALRKLIALVAEPGASFLKNVVFQGKIKQGADR